MLTVEKLHDAFMQLGELARREGKVIELAVYGGSALLLASNFRITTEDVDAVAQNDREFVNRLSDAVSEHHQLPSDWLNDGVRTYLSPNVEGLSEHHTLFRSYPSEQEPGLRVFVPSAEYLLAMKLMAMRLDTAAGKSDLSDILHLIHVVGLKSPEETIAFASSFYPEARISGRLRLGIGQLWRERETSDRETHHAPPAYLGRSRPAP